MAAAGPFWIASAVAEKEVKGRRRRRRKRKRERERERGRRRKAAFPFKTIYGRARVRICWHAKGKEGSVPNGKERGYTRAKKDGSWKAVRVRISLKLI